MKAAFAQASRKCERLMPNRSRVRGMGRAHASGLRIVSEPCRIEASAMTLTRSNAAGPDSANSMISGPNEDHAENVGGTCFRHQARHRRRECGYSICASGGLLRDCCSRQRDNKFSKTTWPGLDANSAAVLLHDDVVRHRQAKSSSFSSGLGDGNGASRAANCKTLITRSFDCNNLEPRMSAKGGGLNRSTQHFIFEGQDGV